MSSPTIITPEEFIKEVKQWGATANSLIKVRMMQKGEFVYCRLTLPNNGETIQTRVTVKKFEEFDWMNLSPIAVPAVWNDESDILLNVEKRLEELNAKPVSYSGNQSIQFR